MRIIIATALAAFAALPAFADQTQGNVVSFDRATNVLVLSDKTVWYIPGDIALPVDLAAGDRLQFDYDTAGEDGLTKIHAITRVAMAATQGARGGS
ncbi:hypothetical protein [Roseovarius atlanticus]|uniref:hypothetical protein n=1 Tax=Roseovarius atlanticus TaxID=1641875 RepID=UPI001C949FF3|nr:hypothetical protein [Roseovarius atlanticus]MBY5988055.1 hypothetical protein [Roseovarius atlanticus]MBY6123446.1 hypothetical protein [Roseovarius atlanticus]MBY6147941.1 hypothetical protein [Roseovarius atlanticus]